MFDNVKPVKIISVEGGIGAGKSTVLETLKSKRPSFHYIDEPVKTWEDAGLLQAMYEGTINKGCFQIAAMSTRFAPLLKAVREGHKIIVTERCPWSDYEVFTRANLYEGTNEMAAYKMAHDALMMAMPPYELYVVYLRTDVDVLLSRMKTRGRSAERMRNKEEEEDMRAYLDNLQARHDAFFHYNGITDKHAVDASGGEELVATQVLEAVTNWCPVKLE